jgi:hypothetical protein
MLVTILFAHVIAHSILDALAGNAVYAYYNLMTNKRVMHALKQQSIASFGHFYSLNLYKSRSYI